MFNGENKPTPVHHSLSPGNHNEFILRLQNYEKKPTFMLHSSTRESSENHIITYDT